MRIDGTPITGQAHTYTPTQQCRRKHDNSKRASEKKELTKLQSTMVAENRNKKRKRKKEMHFYGGISVLWPSEESRIWKGMIQVSIIIILDTKVRSSP